MSTWHFLVRYATTPKARECKDVILYLAALFLYFIPGGKDGTGILLGHRISNIIEGRTRTGRATVHALQLNNLSLLRLRLLWLALGSSPPDWRTPPLLELLLSKL